MTNTSRPSAIPELLFDLRRRMADPLLNDFLAELPAPPVESRIVQPRPIPVLRWFADAVRSTPPAGRPLMRFLERSRAELFWGQTYSVEDVGADFLTSYGWTELVGRRGPVPSGSLACGVLVLGPGTEYPLHAHESEEVYVPLAGTARWKTGESGWLEKAPLLDVIHHPSWVPHAMRTQDRPLAALYVWRGGDLTQKSRIGA